MKYEINIKLTANRKPKLDELNDFLFCRIRDNDLKLFCNGYRRANAFTKGWVQ